MERLMRSWVLTSPMRRGLLRGLIYIAIMEALLPFEAIDWAPVGWIVAGYVVYGLGLSAFIERVLRGHYAESAAALSGLSMAEQNEAGRAMWRGPLPTDPRLREATAQLAGLQLKRSYLRLFAAVGIPLYALRWTFRALDDTPRAWVPVAVLVVAATGTVALHRSLRRRLKVLDPDETWASK